MNKQDKEKFKEVEKAFRQLDYIFSGISWGQNFKNLYNQCAKEERQHRKGCPESLKQGYGCTISEASKYFAVKWILDYSEGNYIPSIKDVLYLKPSCVMSATLCANYPDEIKKALQGDAITNYHYDIDLARIKALDYCSMIK